MCSGVPTPPREHDRTISPALEAVCLKALQSVPEDRYTDASAFSRDLERALSGGGGFGRGGVGRRAVAGAAVLGVGLLAFGI